MDTCLKKLVDRMHVDRQNYFCVVIACNADLEGHILVDESLYQLRIIDGRNAMSDSLCSEG